MKVEQLYTNCLSEAAYFISSNGEAAIIDPLRDYKIYIELAEKEGCKIKYVFETHFHADFVSGHIDLARETGATIIYGPKTETSYPVYVANDGEEFSIGDIAISVIHTPGHTLESTCYLLKDENKNPYCIFTGDTLFVGDVGRPDLFGSVISKEDMAGMMYESLKKLKLLPDNIILYPAHGPGSACGKNLGKETWSTIGDQKKLNSSLQEMTKPEFVEQLTSGLNEPPQYFSLNAAINKKGYHSFDEIVKKNLKPLSVTDFENEIKNGAWVLDTRHQDIFEEGFVPGSVFIGLNGRFAEWVGTVLKMDQPLILVCEDGKEEEAVTRLARVGYENVNGFLSSGFLAWKDAGKPIDILISIEADELAMDMKFEKLKVIDVRKKNEFETGHVEGAENIVLQYFNDELETSPTQSKDHVYVHCQGGYRSVIASSLLKRKGFQFVKNIRGGWSEIQKTTVPISEKKQAITNQTAR
jgi:hydroxyacylglutathione hydrolase